MTIIILQQYGERIHPVVIQTRLKSIYIHIYTNNGNINTVPINVNLYSQWLPQSCRYKHTPSGNRNTKSVNTHISMRPVAISEQLVVRWE